MGTQTLRMLAIWGMSMLVVPVTGAAIGPSIAAPAAIEGAGATFPAPLFAEWARIYTEKTGIAIHYAAMGSGAGIERIQRKEVDFAATDAPLTPEAQQRMGIAQFPVVIGGVVPVVNIAGINPGALTLNGQVLGDIYLGKIRKWSDPAIASLNPGLSLPNSNITVVHRADASGTTFLWTDYLAKVNHDWQSRIGSGTRVDWPVGVSGIGNQGVASYVQRTRMSIGYVEYAYARINYLSHVALLNKDGLRVQPTRDGFAAALATSNWQQAPGFFQIPTDMPGATSWPITGASFLLLRASTEQPAQSREAMKFFSWALASGQAAAERLDYVALPADLLRQVEQAFKTEVRDTSGNAVWQP